MFTISAHAQSQTLLKTAVLATIAVRSVNQTVPLAGARVHGVVLLAATEETLEAQKSKNQHQIYTSHMNQCMEEFG